MLGVGVLPFAPIPYVEYVIPGIPPAGGVACAKPVLLSNFGGFPLFPLWYSCIEKELLALDVITTPPEALVLSFTL